MSVSPMRICRYLLVLTDATTPSRRWLCESAGVGMPASSSPPSFCAGISRFARFPFFLAILIIFNCVAGADIRYWITLSRFRAEYSSVLVNIRAHCMDSLYFLQADICQMYNIYRESNDKSINTPLHNPSTVTGCINRSP